jgi:zinc protease
MFAIVQRHGLFVKMSFPQFFRIKCAMKYLALVVTALLLINPANAIPDIQHWQTANGVRVYFIKAQELPLVDIQVSFDAGSARDGNQSGIAALTNNMLSEGAGGLSTDELLERFAKVGAQFSQEIDREMSSFTLRSLHDPLLLDTAVETLGMILSRPDFPLEAFAREQKRMIHTLEYQKQLPGTLANNAFYRSIYADHPYAFSSDGSIETLSALIPQDLRAFYQRYYNTHNMIIALIGALDRAEAERIATVLSADLVTGNIAPPLPPVAASFSAHLDSYSPSFHSDPYHTRSNQSFTRCYRLFSFVYWQPYSWG